jgi:hypothetical protein
MQSSRVIAAACVLSASLVSCAGAAPQSGPAWNEPEPEHQSGYDPLTKPVTLSSTPPPEKAGEVKIDLAWLACATDGECIVVETECCRYMAVNKAHFADARAALPYSSCDMLCPTNIMTRCVDGRCSAAAP